MARRKAAEVSKGIQPRTTRASSRVKPTAKPSAGVPQRKRSTSRPKRPRKSVEILLRDQCPEKYPDLDFHQSYGSFLTRKNPISAAVDAKIAEYWSTLSTTPTLLQHYFPTINENYRSAFRKFFNTDPISLHGHVSDAMNPLLLTSLLLHLTQHSTKDRIFLLNEEDRAEPRLAIAHGTYGAGFGPLAWKSVLSFARVVSNGKKPFVIQTGNPTRIDTQVKKAKTEGCVALIIELVRSADGSVMCEASWKQILEACKRHCLVLIVDETLTAIRGGAPFAYQLPQYRRHGRPDLVLFGKAVKTNGIAVEWEGINMQKLGIVDIEARELAVLFWQERFTEMAPAADLLLSWGTLVLAAKENWPKRAQVIGRLLRDVIVEEGVDRSMIGGLHSLLYLEWKGYSQKLSPVLVASASKYIRWMPTMDEIMTSKNDLLTKVFGSGSIAHRKQLAAYLLGKDLQLRWCSRCGFAVEAEIKAQCQKCVVRQCRRCEPGAHRCPMGEMVADAA